MRYCDKCGGEIVGGGHNSCASGIFGTPFICDECYDKEVAGGVAAGKAALGIGRLFIGIIIGLCEIVGVCSILNMVARGFSDKTQAYLLVGVECLAILLYLASKIGPHFLRNRFIKFLLRIIGYFTFWLSIVLGISLYFVIKYAI